MNKALGLLFAPLDNDSRAKRAFATLSESFDLTVVPLAARKVEAFPYRVQLPNVADRGLLSALRFFIFCFAVALRLKPQLIYAEGLFPLVPAAFYKMIRFGRKYPKVIYDGRELYLKDQHGHSTYQTFHRLIERIFIGFADQVIAANEARADIVEKHYQLKSPVIALQNIPPLKASLPTALPEEFDYLSDTSKKYIVYQGNLGHLRSIDIFVHVLSRLDSSVHLVLIARGQALQQLKDLARDLGVEARMHIHDFVDHDTLYAVLKKCAAGIITYEMKGPNNEYCAPNKLYEYAQCGLPSITSPQQTFQSVFSSYPIGFALNREAFLNRDYDLLAQETQNFLARGYNPQEFTKFNSHFSWEKEKAKLVQAFS